MKHFSFWLLGIAALTFASCKSSTGPKSTGNTVVMTAIVNGRVWNGIVPFTGTNSGYYDFSAGDSNSDIYIYYTQTDTGTYPINGNSGSDAFATYLFGSNNFYVSYANSGSIDFSKLTSNEANGTFNFKAINTVSPFDTVTITSGTFTIPL
jgi:hypothetical protein